MAEQWISAKKALEIVPDEAALLGRLRAGLLVAKARLIRTPTDQVNDQRFGPKFWTNDSLTDFQFDWQTGDLINSIEGKTEVRLFGVTIALAGLLEMIEIERRPAILRRLSVAGQTAWMSAKEAQKLVLSNGIRESGAYLIEQARLGFVVAKAVEAWGVANPNNFLRYDWEEREWEVPPWFWDGFAHPNGSGTKWEIGQFSGEGLSPVGSRLVEISGVHFLRESVEACFPVNVDGDSKNGEQRKGRKPKYNWPAAIVATYGKIERGEFKPMAQADVEKEMVAYFEAADGGPVESTVRPFAKLIWEESQKP